ncbi:MAG: metallophosphoesterase [Thiobacillaceae bacterium]
MTYLLVFLIYGGIQFYFAAKVVDALDLARPESLLAYGWGIVMTMGPLLNWRLARRAHCRGLAITSAWLIFGWMGFSFIFVWLGLALDAVRWVEHFAGLPGFDSGSALLTLVVLTTGLWIAGFYSARHPRVERLTVRSQKLPSGRSLRIVQLSDVHLGLLIGSLRLDHILQQVNALQPDVLVSTGDLVDAEAHHLDGLSSRLASLQPRYGKIAVTGNHERYAGLEQALNFHIRSGFKLLRGEAMDVTEAITFVGVDDPAASISKTQEAQVLAGVPQDRFVVLLKHQPVIEPLSRFDLQLSGHTHNGQIFPFRLLVRMVYPMVQGRFVLPNGSQLYVSRGTGTWGPPLRILSPPEITLIELTGP